MTGPSGGEPDGRLRRTASGASQVEITSRLGRGRCRASNTWPGTGRAMTGLVLGIEASCSGAGQADHRLEISSLPRHGRSALPAPVQAGGGR